MNAQANGTVRDVLVAKAIQNGYNPYCRSTDKDARTVTEEMRAKMPRVCVPASVNVPAKRQNKPIVREVKASPAVRAPRVRREVVSLENFELVKRKTPALSLGMLVSIFAMGIVLAMVVFSGSLINEEARRYSALSDTYSVLQEENKTLTLALAEKNDLTVIEDVARNDFGMIKVAEAEQRYVHLDNADAVSVYAAEEENTAVPMHLLNAFGEKISNFLEYLD